MPQPTIPRPPEIVPRRDDTRISTCLTGKGQAAALLVRVRDTWDSLSPSQQAECADILTRLRAAMAREHSVGTRVPLLGRIVA